MVVLKQVCLLLCALVASVLGQGLDPEDEQRIDEYVQGLMMCRGMPGTTLAIAGGGQVLLAKGYGVADMDTGQPVTADTVFAVASVSKSFTTTLLAKILNDTDGIDWDTPVRDILGEDFYFGDGYRSNHTTYRDLAAHKTGIPRNDAVWTMAGTTREDLVMTHMRFYEPVAEIRTEYIYNNLMFAVAGTTAEVLRGELWEDLLQEELLDPLEMESTTVYDRAGPDYENFVTPYFRNPEPNNTDELIPVPMDTWRAAGVVGPAASVCSTANDMAKWINFVLSGGETSEGEQLIDPAEMSRLWQAENARSIRPLFLKPESPVTDARPTYSLAYSNGYYREYRCHDHGGDLVGYHSLVSYFPDMDFGVFFSTNYGNHSYERQFVNQFVADIMLGEEPWNTAEEACEIIEELLSSPLRNEEGLPCPCETDVDAILQWRRDANADELPEVIQESCLQEFAARIVVSKRDNTFRQLEDYEGEYGNFGYGNVTVFLNETTELLDVIYGVIGRFDLYPTVNENVFIGNGKDLNVIRYGYIFVFEESAPGSGLVDLLTIPSFESSMPPTFVRGLEMDDAPPPRLHDCSAA